MPEHDARPRASAWLRRVLAPDRTWRDVDAFLDLDTSERREAERRIKRGLSSGDAATRALAHRVLRDVITAEWAEERSATHDVIRTALELRTGRRFVTGERVPGCPCAACRIHLHSRAPRRRQAQPLRGPLNIDAARARSIADVATELGIEHRRGWALCPFHDDSTPSMHLNTRKRAAFCNVCGRSWDPIALVMELRGLSFVDAVRHLATDVQSADRRRRNSRERRQMDGYRGTGSGARVTAASPGRSK